VHDVKLCVRDNSGPGVAEGCDREPYRLSFGGEEWKVRNDEGRILSML
jgi:hypothetical protein